MNFEDLQKAWQNQEAPELTKGHPNHTGTEDMLDRVKALQRKVLRSNIMMSVCLVFTCVFFAYMWLNDPGETIWYDLGMVLIYAAMILTAGIIWLRSVPWGNLKPNLSSREYISQALKNFKFRQTTLKTIMPVYMLLLYLGINFVYLEIFRTASLQTRIWVHLGLTGFIVLLAGLSLYYHKLKYKDNFEPVIKELEELQKEFEEEQPN